MFENIFQNMFIPFSTSTTLKRFILCHYNITCKSTKAFLSKLATTSALLLIPGLLLSVFYVFYSIVIQIGMTDFPLVCKFINFKLTWPEIKRKTLPSVLQRSLSKF